jgi:hypothetical protein
MLACHFLELQYVASRHPSRLPCGSLRSAMTGLDRDASGIYRYEKMAGCSGDKEVMRLPLVGTEQRLVVIMLLQNYT